MSIKALTYNIRHGKGIDNHVDVDRVLAVLASSGADIICLQEVDRSLPRSGYVHQAQYMADKLGFDYSFHANFGILSAGMGNAILCRFPLYSTWNSTLPFLGEPRGLLHSTTRIENREIQIYSTHWGLTPGQRKQQSSAIVRKLDQHSGSVLLCGDLNAPRQAREVDSLLASGHLADCGPVDQLTFTTDFPVVKIDYVLASRELTVQSAKVIHSDASDHLPVLIELAFSC